jgi:ADP-heptose:LPS heptosyltransferase
VALAEPAAEHAADRRGRRGPPRRARPARAGPRGRPLVVSLRALGLGDLLAAVPALRAIRAAHPGARHVLAAPAALAPLARLTGAVDAVVDTRPLAALHPALHHAELLVNLHGRGPQSHRVTLAARPRALIAFAHPAIPETAAAPRHLAREHERARWCRLLAASGIPADPADLRLAEPGRAPDPGAVGATIVHPGAAAPARRWPPERFAALAGAERRAGQAVVVTGSPAERPLAEHVAALAGLPRRAVLAGTTDLVGLAANVAAAARVVSGDTGVAHLAVAFGTPSLTLFGPTPPTEWGPPPRDCRHRVLWRATAPGDPHADRVDPALYAIDADEALRELSRVS